MLHPSLRSLARLTRRRYGLVFTIAALVVVAGLVSSLRLRFDTDVLGLLPKNEPVVQNFRAGLEEFGSVDYLLVAVRLPEGEVVDPYESFVGILGERLAELDQLTEVEYKIGSLEELLEAFLPRALLFLPPDALEDLARALTDDALERRAGELRRLITTPKLLAQKDLVLLDPLGVATIFLDHLESSRAGVSLDWQSGYFLSRDRGMMLVLAKPTGPPQDVDFSKELIVAVEEAVLASTAEWRQEFGDEAPPDPQVDLGGRHVIGVADAGLIRSDMISNAATSMLGVLILFLFAFRRFGLLLYAFVPLACGLVLTFAFAAWAFGTVSAATSGVAALLIGLGIDFVIVSYGRFVEERQRGHDLDEALALMSGSSGRAVVVGGVTSAATLYAFAVTDFTGLFQMGILTGTGILVCMLSVLFLLPAMLAWADDRHQRSRSLPRLFLHGFGSARVIGFAIRNPKAVLAAGFALTALAAWGLKDLRFEDSVKAMRPTGNPGVEVRDEVAERFGVGFDQMMLIVSADELEEVLELAERAETGARGLVREGILQDADSVASLLPPTVSQEAALDWLRAERGDRLDSDRIERVFRDALEKQGVRATPFAKGLDLIRSAIARDQPLTAAELERDSQGQKLMRRYLRQLETGWKSVVYLYPPPMTWRREAPPEALALAGDLGDGAVLTGANVISRYMRERVLKDAVFAAILGFVVVAFLLFLDYRRARATALSLGPLLIGIVWMLGAMGWLGLPMNFMNIFVSTMIIGIGVDYGVHMVHRHREFAGKSAERRQQGLVETGKAITLAALSTIIGFGSLSQSHFPGLSSMGMVAILGALSTCIVAISVLPAFLTWLEESPARD
ncbi:MAG: MMPL family transporter [bacterium]|nr:MMPL family transporter [bacterium]